MTWVSIRQVDGVLSNVQLGTLGAASEVLLLTYAMNSLFWGMLFVRVHLNNDTDYYTIQYIWPSKV